MKTKSTSVVNLKATACATLLAAASFLAPSSDAYAALLFEDNFDGAQYDGGFVAAPPTGTLPQGIWYVNNQTDGAYSGQPGDRTNVTLSQALSPTRSLALNVSSATDRAQLIGMLSSDGLNATPTTSAINVRFAFNRGTATSSDGPTVFVVRDSNEQNMSVVNIGVDGRIEVLFGNGTQELSPILGDTWYYLSVDMPANPGTSIEYKVSLFGADGVTLINSVTGSSAGTAGVSYSYFSIVNNGQAAPLTTYIDNVSAQAIPEPSTVGLAVAGVVGTVLLVARRKN